MTNPITDFLRKRLIEPEVERATSGIRKELGRAKARLEQKDFDLITQISGKFGVNSNRSKKRKYLESYVSWVYANINVIAEKVADIHFEMYKVSNKAGKDSLDTVDDSPALDLLLRVNDFQTKWDLIYTWTFHMLSMGEAAWYLVGRNNPNAEPREIWSLRPDYLEIIPGNLEKNEFVERYEYKVPGKETVIFAPWEILFFRNPHPTNAYRGYGIVEAAASDIDTDAYAMNFNRNFYQNFARPDAVLTTENKLSDETFDRVQKVWHAKYGGTDNAGKTAILESGLKYEAIQPTQNDMQFLEQMRWNRDKFMAMFRNTKMSLGIVEDVNRANAETSELVWIKHTIKPKMQRLVDYLNEFLIPVYGDNLFLGFEDPLPETVELKLSEYEKGIDKWLTRNEIREREGLDPVDGGDFLYVPLTSLPLGTDQEKPQEMPEKTLRLKVQKGKGEYLLKRYASQVQRIKNRKSANKRMTDQIDKVVNKLLAPHKAWSEDGIVNKDIQQKRWEQFIKVTDIFEVQVGKMVEAVINRHEDKTIALLGEKYKPRKSFKTKGIDDLLPDDEDFVTLSIDALKPVFAAIAAEQGKDVFDFLGITQQFDTSAQLLKALDRVALKASDSYIGTVRDKIKEALKDGISEGEALNAITKRVRKAYDGLTELEAKRVARTETVRVTNATNEDAYKQSGVVRGKQWFTAMDERVDDICAELDGKIVDLEDDFDSVPGAPAGYKDIPYPPIHVNCRCTTSPVVLSKSAKPAKKAQKVREVIKIVEKQPEIDVESIKSSVREQIEQEMNEKLDKVIQAVQDDQ